jgi:hypothetical protein
MRQVPGAAPFAAFVVFATALAARVRSSTVSAANALLREQVGRRASPSLAARSVRVFKKIPARQ